MANLISIASRKSWGAKYRDGVGSRPTGNLEVYLHHSVTSHLPENATVEQERAQMRVIESIGQQRFGAGISYTVIVFPSGRAYWGASAGRISYHSGPGRNTRGLAICLAGNYEANKIGSKAINGVGEVLRYLRQQKITKAAKITEAHRDFSATACPGNHAYKAIGKMNSAAAGSAAKPSTPKPAAPKPATPKPAPAKKEPTAKVKGYLKGMGLSQTRAGVVAYQKTHGLYPDGDWGPVTERYYQWVRKLQTALNRWKAVQRIGRLRVDGYRGRLTRNAENVAQNQPGNRAILGYSKAELFKGLGIGPEPKKIG